MIDKAVSEMFESNLPQLLVTASSEPVPGNILYRQSSFWNEPLNGIYTGDESQREGLSMQAE